MKKWSTWLRAFLVSSFVMLVVTYSLEGYMAVFGEWNVRMILAYLQVTPDEFLLQKFSAAGNLLSIAFTTYCGIKVFSKVSGISLSFQEDD